MCTTGSIACAAELIKMIRIRLVISLAIPGKYLSIQAMKINKIDDFIQLFFLAYHGSLSKESSLFAENIFGC
jgi:hypothetical protein